MIMDSVSSPEQPKNKILVTFGDGDSIHQRELISQLFGIDIGIGDRIVKGLVWKTKYYRVEFDLYIDDYNDFSSWFQEFASEEFAALREAMAGLVVVDQYEPTKPLNPLGLQDTFVVWVNTDSKVGQDQVDEINDKLFQTEESTVELVNLHSNEDTNEYGEKIGIPRFKEIVDTCSWKNCDMDYLTSTSSTTNPEVSLELIVQRMQHARLKHANSEMDNDEALQIAQEIAEELTGKED
ncbi:hypothetical protein ZYGR_0P03760 [Zygosaccharomyces rouxii]|uniref:Increased recombination centers protein 6 n=2 Tax=Zygosaccharomyces rouxii TaxID=4956 RepID=IRC6_ZYGRC|nr:uncharacterized protein ZYRO0E09152g [Zygosaccharomyces rouxii]C5E4V9.1 RecName: Full=Increased recombination centers protein 6 [Zygosaccharomyces rouxii CBS 732]KAH9198075.1 increased recombination centers protein 6 [Zygosaccharomyces rouxii]GAV49730.1 hypothetical protein ZYGR_0P03760 [Zygosaccharomyces rouxii]CAR31070.1 ZYRO0E09152p [Zygosaccharomyces rouxii]